MRPIGRAVDRALRALGVDRDVARADAVRAWRGAVVSVLGPDAAITRAIRAEGDTLLVVAPTPQWAGEIRLRERELVRALAERAPASDIAHVRVAPEVSARR